MRYSSKLRGASRAMSARASRRQQIIRTAIETLETRVLMSTVTYIVQSNSDTVASIITPSGANQYTANTLRAAVNAANLQPFAAVIQFNAAKFTGGTANTITLTSGLTLGPVAPAGTHTYKLVGPTAKPITVSGAATYTDFTIANGVSAEFDTLTIAHGVATNTGSDGDIDGGGIYSSGPLTLVGDTFAGNTSAEEGGAVYSNTGLITVSKTSFTANSAEYGGAVYINGTNSATTPTITAGTFTANIATGEGGAVYFYDTVSAKFTISTSTFTGNTAEEGSGGAVLIDNELDNSGDTITTTISGSTFTGNTTDGSGGAVQSNGTTLTITNDTFNNDKAIDSEDEGVDGGAICSDDDTLTVSGSQFTGDSASDDGGAIDFGGGGRHHRRRDLSDSVTISNSTFTNCSATGAQGGAIAVELEELDQNSTLTVTASTFTGDKANDGGGAIIEDDFGSGMANLVSASLTSDTFSGDSTSNDNGGAVLVDATTLTVTSDTFSNDSANDAVNDGSGGGLFASVETFTAANSTFTNDSSVIGGGIAVEANTSTITGCTFTNDSALLGNEGQPEVSTTSKAVSPADIVDENGGAGGGVYSESTTLTVTNSSFTHDNAAVVAGALASADDTLVVDHSTFSNNTAQDGGAIGFGGAVATISNSTFTSNTATTDDGGAIYLDDDSQGACSAQLAAKPLAGSNDDEITLNVVGDTFTNNTAGGEGGAISFDYEEDDTMDTVNAAVAPADVFDGAELNITQSTFTTNSATFGGGAVYAESFEENGDINVFNSTFNGNSTSFDGGGAIWDGVTEAQIANDTFINNAAGNDLGGGGLYVHFNVDVTVTDCTFDENSAGYGLGGGIGIGGAENADVILDGDIVAGNYVTGTPSTDNDLEGAFDSTSTDNIIGDGSFNQTGFTVGNVGGNFVGTNLKPINPLLASLANNGGPTQTQALEAGSLAIGNNSDWPVFDSSSNDVTITDQRGVDRPQDQGYDIGAYQSGATVAGVTPTVSISAPATVHVPSSGTTTIQVPVTLSSTAGSAIVLTYSTLGGSATSGNGDYNGVTNATSTIPAGSPAGTYFITITGVKHETAHGAYPKTFQVKLSAATNATVVGGTETVTVTLAFP